MLHWKQSLPPQSISVSNPSIIPFLHDINVGRGVGEGVGAVVGVGIGTVVGAGMGTAVGTGVGEALGAGLGDWVSTE
jgi:hypothetical protein